MNLLEHYQRSLASGEMLEDSQQIQVIQKLQRVYDTLLIPKRSWLPIVTNNSSKGIYLWGNVGIGKTFLMDLFYHQLPFEQKCRTHFLPFMREIHAQLNRLQGTENPLLKIAKDWSCRVRVICFDEFLVNDIADASILGRLLAAFFSQDICMVFTSNFEPDDLTPVVYVAETMTIGQLNRFINKERARGNANINTYLVVFYKKFSLPVSAFILTIIAVAVSSMKRRGGMGVNLAIGIIIAFVFIFFDKVFGTLAEKSSIPAFIAVWLPNFVFGILAYYLLRNAKR